MVYEKVIEYCKAEKLSVSAFEKRCGLANGTVRHWKEQSGPSVRTLQKIEEATGIPISKWIE